MIKVYFDLSVLSCSSADVSGWVDGGGAHDIRYAVELNLSSERYILLLLMGK